MIGKVSYNNNYNSSNGMDPFEALYRRTCRYPIGWLEVGEFDVIGPVIVVENVLLIRDMLKTSKVGKNSMPTVERGTLNLK